ncbi:MAG TPA: glycosyltransferase family 2 protein, partial [Gemmatimonadaceae bacterium]|nr:glycosyltransferase family 2 protein [Gemmatimonadaceae bacterium]
MRRAACVIPAYQAADSVAAVVQGVREHCPQLVVIVVDDGSTDATQASAIASGADHVLRHAHNRGKGAALRTAFAHAFTIEPRVDAVVTVDADGQHDPAALPALLAALASADLVIGARRRRGTSMPLHRRLGNAISTRAIAWCAGRPISDAQCGFRAIRRTLLERVPHVGERYEAETAFVIRAARAGAIIAETEIPTRYGPPSHFRPLRDAARVVAAIWAHRPSRLPACDSSAPTTTASSPMVSTAWSAPPNR